MFGRHDQNGFSLTFLKCMWKKQFAFTFTLILGDTGT